MRFGILGPVNTPSYCGGVATFDEGLAAALVALGLDVFICTEQADTAGTAGGCRVHSLKDTPFAAVVKEERPDVLLASLAYGKYLIGSSVPEGCLTIYYLHGFFDSAYYPFWKVLAGSLFQKRVCASSSYVIANSTFTANVNSRKWGIKIDSIIPPGVSAEFLDPHTHKRRESLSKHILYVGRLHEAKHVDLLIRAFGIVSKDRPDTSLLIVGDGPHGDELRAIASNLDPNIEFLGRVQGEALRRLYSGADVFVSLNDREPFGITFCEALLSGCRIVCPSTGGQAEFLADRISGVALCGDLKPETVAEKVLLMLSDVHALPPLKDADRAWFSYERAARDLLDLIEREKG